MTIGEFIRMKRLAAEMSQAALYQALPTQREKSQSSHGAGRDTISRMETGVQGITFAQFCAIAEALNYKASEFLQEFEKI